MNTEPWVTAEQVAQHLGVVKDTVYRWRERKGLPAHKIGRLWKFQLSEVGANRENGKNRTLSHSVCLVEVVSYDIKPWYKWWANNGGRGRISERSFAPSQKPRNPQALPCCGFRRFRLLSRRRSTASLAACLQMFLVLVGPGHHQLVTANHLVP